MDAVAEFREVGGCGRGEGAGVFCGEEAGVGRVEGGFGAGTVDLADGVCEGPGHGRRGHCGSCGDGMTDLYLRSFLTMEGVIASIGLRRHLGCSICLGMLSEEKSPSQAFEVRG